MNMHWTHARTLYDHPIGPTYSTKLQMEQVWETPHVSEALRKGSWRLCEGTLMRTGNGGMISPPKLRRLARRKLKNVRFK